VLRVRRRLGTDGYGLVLANARLAAEIAALMDPPTA
jgi:hypothetical protein